MTSADRAATGTGVLDQYDLSNADSKTRRIDMIDPATGEKKQYAIIIPDPKKEIGAYVDAERSSNQTFKTKCGIVASDLSTAAQSMPAEIRAIDSAKKRTAEEAARKAAATVYANAICGSEGASSPALMEKTAACGEAVLKCIQPSTAKIPGPGGETYPINETPETIDKTRVANCIFRTAGTGLGENKILELINTNFDAANQAAATARTEGLAGVCDNSTTASYCNNGDTTTAEKDPCDGLPNETQMRWLACAALTAGSGIVNWLYSAIQDLLYTPVDKVFTESFQNVANSFRNIGLALIVIAGLVMIIAQATGSDIVDAYTVKKVMPKLGFALVGIAVAWPLLKLVIGLTNDLGILVGEFVVGLTPGGGDAFGAPGDVAGAGFIGVLGFIIGGAKILQLGWSSFTLIGAGIFALGLGLFVLALRQLVLIMLVLLAPLAIASSVLPGTEKLWKFWKNTLFTVMLMFPLIMLFLKSGEFMSNIFVQMDPENLVSVVVGLIVFFAPYFMLPFAFKMAGGLMSTIFGIVNDKSKGGFDRMRGMRQEASKRNLQRMADGNRLNDARMFGLGRRFNTMTRGAANIGKLGYNPAQWSSRMRTAMNDQAHDLAGEYGQKDAAFGAIKGDDAKLYAARATTRKEIEDRLAEKDSARYGGAANAQARTDAANQILLAQRGTNQATFQRARVIAQASTGTAYQRDGMFDASMALEDIKSAYGSDISGAERAIAAVRSGLSNSGQIAGQAGYGDWDAAYQQMLTANPAKKEEYAATREAVNAKIMNSAIDSAPPQYAIHGKPSSAAAMGATHFARIQDLMDKKASGEAAIKYKKADGTEGMRAVNDSDIEAAVAHAAGVYDALSTASPLNADAYAQQLFGRQLSGSAGSLKVPKVDAGGSPIMDQQTGGVQYDQIELKDMTVRQVIATMGSNPSAKAFHDRRNDFRNRSLEGIEKSPQQPYMPPQSPYAK